MLESSTSSPATGSASIPGLFATAAAAVGVVEHRITVAGLPMRLRYAGEAMRHRLDPPFAHLTRTGSEPVSGHELTVDIWDAASTGTDHPPSLGEPVEGDGPGTIHYYEQGPVRALARWETLSVLDSQAAHAWFWTADPADMLSWDWASPLRNILHWWLGSHGSLQVHGGAVGEPHGGVLVVGRGGSGKSTTTLASLFSGLRYAGDDFVGVSVEPEPWVHSLYCSGKLENYHIGRFPRLAGAIVNPERTEDEKVVVTAGAAAPGVPIEGFPLRAVLIPRVVAVEPETRLVPASRAAALAALAPSTIFQLHPPHPDALRSMGELVRRVPCYTLELGRDIDAIPDAIRVFLEGGE